MKKTIIIGILLTMLILQVISSFGIAYYMGYMEERSNDIYKEVLEINSREHDIMMDVDSIKWDVCSIKNHTR